eukprot:5522876-Amphidinium_carterae.1
MAANGMRSRARGPLSSDATIRRETPVSPLPNCLTVSATIHVEPVRNAPGMRPAHIADMTWLASCVCGCSSDRHAAPH